MSDQTIMEILDSLYDDNSDPTSEHIEAIESETTVVSDVESKTTLPVSTFYKIVPSIVPCRILCICILNNCA